MRIHYIQHVPFEGPASIGLWADQHGHRQSYTRVYEKPDFPGMDSLDRLVVMGGPMGVCDELQYPWLKAEKKFIRKAIDAGKVIVGICLGAQLIAEVLGAKVFSNKHKEIGWFPVELTPDGSASSLLGFLPDRFTAFHWHGDTFDLPKDAVHLARSEGCLNQAFLYKDRVLGLQFHLESTEQSIRELALNCKNDILPDRYIQSSEDVLSASPVQYRRINEAMYGILDRLPS
ncbi:MAG: type 1 glutamine amidotransferase [Desulfobacterales bacterium]|jgi:GMP synthase (glutamine-hydrolysing)|nr:type 1 glutamine amidotransferase [Desulfobacterales bacterium]